MGADLLAVHRELLERWRGAMNLVGPGDLDEHYRDAEHGLRGVAPSGRWADLGTGAGFPGIVFAARFPMVMLDLVDSRAKRCAFLREVLGRAGIQGSRVAVVRSRVEDLAPATYDGVLARAFVPSEDVLAHAERLLVPGGSAVLFLGPEGPLPERSDWRVFHVEQYTVGPKRRRCVEFRWEPPTAG